MSRPGVAAPDQLPDGPGIAVLVTAVPGGVRSATDDAAALIAWLARHRAPHRRSAHAATAPRLDAQVPDPAAATRSELWASARFAGVEQARAAARPFEGRVDGLMRWTPADRPAETTSAPVTEPRGAQRA
jgi:hypothetical protein